MTNEDVAKTTKRTSTIKFRYLRHIIQAQILILLLYGITNHSLPIHLLWRVDPILSISAAISGAVMPFEFLILTIFMFLVATALGRVFCGWICPLGFIQDLTSFGKRKSWMHENFRYVKYVLLLGGLIMPVMVGWTYLEWITPMSILPRALAPIWGVQEGIVFGVAIFLIVVVFSAVTEKRAWCRYICPLGAILSLPAAKKAVGIGLNEEKCIRCLKCERACTMGIIDIKGQSGIRWDSECIACLACRDACPVDAIGLSFRS